LWSYRVASGQAAIDIQDVIHSSELQVQRTAPTITSCWPALRHEARWLHIAHSLRPLYDLFVQIVEVTGGLQGDTVPSMRSAGSSAERREVRIIWDS
jgi:hypothetical protein